MDIAKLKNLVKQNGDKFVFLENGEPEMVVMSFGEYEKLVKSDSNLRMHSNYSNHSSDKFESFESLMEETEFMVPVTTEAAGMSRNTISAVAAGDIYPVTRKPRAEVSEEVDVQYEASNWMSRPESRGNGVYGVAEVDMRGIPVRLEDIRLEDLPI